jgi:hypothetical protein
LEALLALLAAVLKGNHVVLDLLIWDWHCISMMRMNASSSNLVPSQQAESLLLNLRQRPVVKVSLMLRSNRWRYSKGWIAERTSDQRRCSGCEEISIKQIKNCETFSIIVRRPSHRPHYLRSASVAPNVTFPLSWEVDNKQYRIHVLTFHNPSLDHISLENTGNIHLNLNLSISQRNQFWQLKGRWKGRNGRGAQVRQRYAAECKRS